MFWMTARKMLVDNKYYRSFVWNLGNINMCKNALVTAFVLLLGCAGTGKKHIIYDYNEGTVRAAFINGNFDTSAVVRKQDESVEQILKKHFRNNPNITVFDHAADAKADYEIRIYLDSFYLVSYDIQKLKLGKKDSILSRQRAEQDHLDSSYRPLTPGQRIGGSIAASILLNAALLPFGGFGVIVMGEGERPSASLSLHDRSFIEKIHFKPKLKGRIEVIHNSKAIWSKAYAVDDDYDRFVSYEEQVEMLIRILIRNQPCPVKPLDLCLIE
jgi:hypothetical protein